MLFRFVIHDPFEGAMKGTNNETTARQFADCEDYLVVDTATGEWLLPGGDSTDVSEITAPGDEDGEEDE